MADKQIVNEIIIRARDQASRVLAGVEKNLSSLGLNLGSIQRLSGLALGGIAGIAGAAATGLIAAAKAAANYADEMGKAAQRTGVNVETLSGLRHAADLADISFEDLTTAFSRQAKTALAAAQGNKEAAGAFQQLGITVTRQNGTLKNQDELLLEIAERFQKMPDGINKTAAAQEIFGKSGAKLITLLNGGAKGIRDFIEQAKKLGLVVTEDMAKAAEEFNDSLTVLNASIFGLKVRIGSDLIPQLIKLLDLFARLRGVSLPGMESRELQGQLEAIDGQIQALQDRMAGKGGFTEAAQSFINFLMMTPGATKEQFQGVLDEMIKRRDEIQSRLKELEGSAAKRDGGEKPLGGGKADDSAIKKLEAALQSYRQSLIATIQQQEIERVKLELGEQAALRASQAYQVLALRAGLAADKLPIPPEVKRSAAEAESTLKSLGANVSILGEKSFAVLQAGALSGADSLRVLTLQLERLAGAGKMFDQDFDEMLNIDKDVAAMQQRTADALQRFREMQREISIGMLSDDQQRHAKIVDDFARMAGELDRIGREAGKSQEEIAETVAAAWQKALKDMRGSAEGDFKAIERVIDSFGEGLEKTVEGLLLGTRKSFDIRESIRNMFLSAAKETLQQGTIKPLQDALKTAIRQILNSVNVEINASSSGGGGFLGFLGGIFGKLIGGLFGGGGASYTPGSATGYEAGFFAKGGRIGAAQTHRVVSAAVFAGARRMASGGPADIGSGEIPIIAHAGEYVMNKRAVQRLGFTTVDRMNWSGELPTSSTRARDRWPAASAMAPAPIIVKSEPQIIIKGDIIPERPGMSRDQVIEIVSSDLRQGGKSRDSVLHAVGK